VKRRPGLARDGQTNYSPAKASVGAMTVTRAKELAHLNICGAGIDPDAATRG